MNCTDQRKYLLQGWRDLGPDILEQVHMRLSDADTMHVGHVCRSWSKLTRDGVPLVVRTAPQRLVQTLKHISAWQPQRPLHTRDMSVRISDASSSAEMGLEDWESYLKDLCRQLQVATSCFVLGCCLCISHGCVCHAGCPLCHRH